MARTLSEWTGQRWMVSLVEGKDGSTIAEERAAARVEKKDRIAATPTVRAIMDVFPGAEIDEVRAVAADLSLDPDPNDQMNEGR